MDNWMWTTINMRHPKMCDNKGHLLQHSRTFINKKNIGSKSFAITKHTRLVNYEKKA